MGDSGSAGMLGEKCVIIWAPKLDTKIDQKWCQQQKSDKNQQKLTKHQNAENEKNQKSSKVTKSWKWKNIKMLKSENAKSEKNIKKWPPPEKGQNVR